MPENKKAGKPEVKEEPVEPTPSLTDVPEEVKSKKGRTIFVCVDQSKYTASLLDWCVDTMFQPTDKIVLMNVQSFVPFPVGLYPRYTVPTNTNQKCFCFSSTSISISQCCTRLRKGES